MATYRAASGGKPPTWVLIDWSTLKTRLAPGATDASTAAVRGGKLWLFAADGKTLKAWTAPDGP